MSLLNIKPVIWKYLKNEFLKYERQKVLFFYANNADELFLLRAEEMLDSLEFFFMLSFGKTFIKTTYSSSSGTLFFKQVIFAEFFDNEFLNKNIFTKKILKIFRIF